ncbi:MAG: 50S ribosomal protein L9 [Elusimicrobia bacterium RIFCSPLOWO2_01_FULL_54_10]|nr:MAG: 50S ribosomal protein L9 [Elusimicrobia bacterium RIFCSPLOWO2_01_FULL_54_10]
MQVILCEDIDKVGLAGEIKAVAEGFARNFLFPKKLAYPATAGNLKKWESEKHVREVKLLKSLESAKALAAELGNISLEIPARAGREGHLFGSITSPAIAQALLKKGFSVDRKTIELAAPIKNLGTFEVPVRLHSQVEARLKVEITRSAESAVPAS